MPPQLALRLIQLRADFRDSGVCSLLSWPPRVVCSYVSFFCFGMPTLCFVFVGSMRAALDDMYNEVLIEDTVYNDFL